MQVVTCSLPLSLSCNCPFILIQQHKIRFSPYFHEQIDLCLLMRTTLSKKLSGLVLFSSTDPFKFCDLVFRLLLEANMYKHLLHASLSLLPLTIPCQAHFFLWLLLTITATLVVPLGVIFSAISLETSVICITLHNDGIHIIVFILSISSTRVRAPNKKQIGQIIFLQRKCLAQLFVHGRYSCCTWND